jgi:hypothetical protein
MASFTLPSCGHVLFGDRSLLRAPEMSFLSVGDEDRGCSQPGGRRQHLALQQYEGALPRPLVPIVGEGVALGMVLSSQCGASAAPVLC